MAHQQQDKGQATFDCDRAAAEPLLLPRTMLLEQSLQLADGKILTVSVDAPAGEFILVRHLRSSALDLSFGQHGVQRIASDVAHDASGLSLESERDGTVVIRGRRINETSGSLDIWHLRIMPTDQLRPRLGVHAFLSLSHWPFAGATNSPQHARDYRI